MRPARVGRRGRLLWLRRTKRHRPARRSGAQRWRWSRESWSGWPVNRLFTSGLAARDRLMVPRIGRSLVSPAIYPNDVARARSRPRTARDPCREPGCGSGPEGLRQGSRTGHPRLRAESACRLPGVESVDKAPEAAACTNGSEGDRGASWTVRLPLGSRKRARPQRRRSSIRTGAVGPIARCTIDHLIEPVKQWRSAVQSPPERSHSRPATYGPRSITGATTVRPA